MESKPYFTNNGQYIRTSNLVQITKILKGNLKCGTIEIITNGGELDNREISISHSLELYPNAMGIFLCNETTRPLSPIDFYSETNIEKLEGQFENQSFIQYWWNGQTINAADVWQNFDSLNQVYNIVEQLSGMNFIDCGDGIKEIKPEINLKTAEEDFPIYLKEDFDELINYAKFKKENYTRLLSAKSLDKIFYSLDNLSITGITQKYLEFDVNVKDNLGTKFLDQSAVRIEYDPIAFGTNIVANGNIIVTRGTLNADPNCYSSPIPTDANNNTILIPALETVFSQCKAPILQTDQSIMHIKMKIQTCNIPNDIALVDTSTFFGPSLIINYSAYADFPADTFQTYYDNLEHSQIKDVPECISYWPKTLAGGIDDTLTIKGNSFGINKGYILFPNADDGGTSEVLIEGDQISLWNDSIIKFVIPSSANHYVTTSTFKVPAGTGIFKVHSEFGASILVDTIEVVFSVMNHPTDYRPYVVAPWTSMNKKFTFRCDTVVANYDGGKMKEVIDKALRDWKCLTGINWELGSDINSEISDPLIDEVCTISFFNYPDSSTILAATHVRKSRSISSSDTSYQIFENDIVINSDKVWFSDTISTTIIPSGQKDFYETILHELGHAHGLNHVIDPNAVMHFSVNNSTRLIDLPSDLSCDHGGNWMADYTNNLSNLILSTDYNRMNFDTINPCSSILEITEMVNLEDVSITVFPNPCQQNITVSIEDEIHDKMIVSIHDLNGKLIKQTESLDLIDVSNLDGGSYYLRIHSMDGKFQGAAKFIKR